MGRPQAAEAEDLSIIPPGNGTRDGLNLFGVSDEVLRLLPGECSLKRQVIPLTVDDGVVTVATHRPDDSKLRDDLEFAMDRPVQLTWAPQGAIAAAVEQLYGDANATPPRGPSDSPWASASLVPKAHHATRQRAGHVPAGTDINDAIARKYGVLPLGTKDDVLMVAVADVGGDYEAEMADLLEFLLNCAVRTTVAQPAGLKEAITQRYSKALPKGEDLDSACVEDNAHGVEHDYGQSYTAIDFVSDFDSSPADQLLEQRVRSG